MNLEEIPGTAIWQSIQLQFTTEFQSSWTLVSLCDYLSLEQPQIIRFIPLVVKVAVLFTQCVSCINWGS